MYGAPILHFTVDNADGYNTSVAEAVPLSNRIPE
jgi:hypothetical protein